MDGADAWIDAVGQAEASAMLASAESVPPGRRLSACGTIAEGIALHGPGARERAATEAVRELAAAGASRTVRRGVEAAFRTMAESEATQAAVDGFGSAVQAAAEAMHAPEWAAPLQTRGAVRILNDQLAETLMRLEHQSRWLVDCGDPMLHPGMRAAMDGLLRAAARRRHLARAAGVWDSADEATRRSLLEASRLIERGEDTAGHHAWIASISQQLAPASQVPIALERIGWSVDPAARLTWQPSEGIDRGAQGRLLTLLERRHHLAGMRHTGRWRQACEAVEHAARAVLQRQR